MRVNINLAREPFRRDRAAIAASAIVASVLTVALILLLALFWTDRATTANERKLLADLNGRLARLQKEQGQLDRRLREAGNAQVLDRSIFLNSLIFRKAISWTKLFSDLEKVTPYNVRVISIRPQVDAKNHIYLDMVVGSETQENIVNMLMKLESSDVFGSVETYGVIPPSQTDPYYRYRLAVNYAQKL